MANHTIDCKWCGEDIRTMGTVSVSAHEDSCAKNPANLLGQEGPPKIEDLVGSYVELRDELGRKRKEFKQFEAETKRQMEELEIDLLQKSRDLGVESFKTKHGTAFKTDKDFARVGGPEGWELLCRYMVDNNDFGLVEKRVAKLHFKEVMNELGVAPQDIGVEYVVEEVIQVRRS